MKKIMTRSLAVLALGTVIMTPSLANAQSWHRQAQKQQWQNIAIGAGVVGLIGALTHNDGLTAAGVAGAVYSTYRYDTDGNRWQDRDRDHPTVWNRGRRGDSHRR